MELRLTQSKAAYSAHPNIEKERAALFRRFRVAAGKQTHAMHRRLTRIGQRLHRDNGR
jgi:hypothetical protein